MFIIIGVVALIIWIVCLVANIKIAQKRQKSVALWVVLSVFFSWIALIINAILLACQKN